MEKCLIFLGNRGMLIKIIIRVYSVRLYGRWVKSWKNNNIYWAWRCGKIDVFIYCLMGKLDFYIDIFFCFFLERSVG